MFVIAILLLAACGLWAGAAATSTAASKNSLSLMTMQNYLPRMVSNIYNEPSLLRYYKEAGLLTVEDLVGEEEVLTLDREDNSNGEWFDGADPASVAPQLGLVDCYIGHHNFRTTMQITDTEALENEGRARLRSKLKQRMLATERRMKVDISQALIGARGSNTKRPEGIRDLMGGGTPASSMGSLHQLSGVTYTWWAPEVKVTTALGPNNSGIRADLLALFLDLQTNGGKPKIGICDAVYYLEYAKQVGGGREVAGYPVANPKTFSGDRPAGTLDTAGSPDLAFNGARIRFDGYVAVPSAYTAGTDGHCNWVDTDFFEIAVDPRWNFKVFKPRPRAGGDKYWADVYAMAFRCTTRCYRRMAHGLHVLDI